MSYTIHSVPRTNLPGNQTRMAMRAIAGLQDAKTFQEARDALLRFYYPIVRTFTQKGAKSEKASEEREDWTMDLLNSGSETHVSLFFKKAYDGSSQMDSDTTARFQECIDMARKSMEHTPYERVGQVLAWIKAFRTTQPQIKWSHSGLRQWMQSVLIDFTLADAKKTPGAMLSDPDAHYRGMVASWSAEQSGLPFDSIWNMKSHPWFTKKVVDTISNVNNDSGKSSELLYHFRAKLIQESKPAMALMLHPNLGVTRRWGSTWRDVTDYGVLHPLLTLNESSFDKSVWLDLLQYQGNKWSSTANENTWYEWQERAQASYQQILQAYTGSTPNAVAIPVDWQIQSGTGTNLLQSKPTSPLQLDWYSILSDLTRHFPYLNQSPEIKNMAELKLNSTEQARFALESQERTGQPMILALTDLPTALQQVNALNMPAWFHVQLQENMKKTMRFELPEDLLDDDQAPHPC